MKTIGIIGGQGPETTAKFYIGLITECRKINGEAYPPIIINSIPLLLSIENDVAVLGKNENQMLPYLLDSAKLLEKAGADFGVIPCNTAHIFIDEVRKSVNIPFLSIIEETVEFSKAEKIKNISLLATNKTVSSGLYAKSFESSGVNLLTPDSQDQDILSKIISRILNGEKNNQDKEIILNILKKLQAQGAEAVIFGCTDLQLLLDKKDSNMPVIDTVDVLVKASAKRIFS